MRSTINKDYFKEINTLGKAYFLGLFYADGCLTLTPRARMVINLKDEDSKILYILKEDIEFTGNISLWKKLPPRQNQRALCILDKDVIKDLNSLGGSERKSKHLNIPEIKDEFIWHFIRGFFDGDGSISRNKNKCKISIICLDNMGMFLKSYMDEVGIKSTFKLATKGKYTISNLGFLTICGKIDIKMFMDKLYDNKGKFFMERKYNIFDKAFNTDKIHIFEMYGFGSGSSVYLLNEDLSINTTYRSTAESDRDLGLGKSQTFYWCKKTRKNSKLNKHRLIFVEDYEKLIKLW